MPRPKIVQFVQELKERRIAKGVAPEQFRGVEEPEITGLEKRLGVAFPPVYREYLRVMGREPGGAAKESDIRFGCLHLLTGEMRDEASGAGVAIDDDAVAIFAHQGYDYVYFRTSEAAELDDPPLYRLQAAAGWCRPAFASISEYLLNLFGFGNIVPPPGARRGDADQGVQE